MSARIRAIPSTLSVKSSPLVPPAASTFDPVVKNVLRHRLIFNMFPSMLAFSWVLTTVTFIWMLGGLDIVGIKSALGIPFRPFTLVVTGGAWFCVAVPVLVLRKTCLTAHQPIQTSPLKTIQAALRRISTRRAALTYLISALVAAAIHVLLARMNETTDPRLNIFVKSRKHPTYLNGRLIFVLLSQCSVAFIATLRNVMLDRMIFRWSSQPRKSLSVGDFVRAMIVTTVLASISVPISLPLFGILRLLIRLPLLRTLLKPFTAHFARGSYSFVLFFQNLPLISRAWVLAWSTLNIWEIAEMVFDAYVSRPVPIAPADVLVSGVSSSNITFKYFAYAEITPQKFFAGAASNLWPTLCRESLLILGRDYQHLLHRGVPPLPPLPAPAPIQAPVAIPATPVSALRRPVFKTESRSPVSQLVESLAGDSVAEVPDAVKSIIPAPPIPTNLSRFLPEVKIPSWLTQERQSKVVESLLPSRDLDLLVVDVLSNIVSASLTDDKYGVVQRDIPKVLEALCVFLDEVEMYQREMTPGDEEERQKSAEILGAVADGLHDGISRIVRTFGTKLSAFKFPPRVASKLQGFVDYL